MLTTAFLMEAGLPESAGLSFDDLAKGPLHIYEVYGPLSSWNEEDRQRLKAYLMIGSDGAGNPVCIDVAHEEQIVLPDHEDNFNTVQFVNSSVAQLAECLLTYSEMIQTLQREFGKEALMSEDAVPPELFEATWTRFHAIDARALEDGCFWQEELKQFT